jgi:Uncharacterized conserved protein
MDIIVRGDSSSSIKPDKVILSINFYVKSNTYQNVLDKGANNVNHFVTDTLPHFNFTKEDLKTNRFNVRKETRYNSVTKNHEFDGYSYSQNTRLEFDYDIEKLSEMMEAISKLEDSPVYEVNFGVKDEKSYRDDLLAKAYQDAESKARAIASAAQKELRRCEKVDFKSFGTDYTSSSRLGQGRYAYKQAAVMESDMVLRESTANVLADTFNPEDIEVSETLYCLWIAE